MTQTIQDQITSIIHDDYLNDFLDIYGVTISIAEKHPEQVNNEVRNALTHLARALIPDIPDPQQEIEDAKKHLQRAKRDCLKLSIIHKREQLVSSIYRIELTEGTLRRAIKTKLRAIETKRKDIFRRESAGEPVVDELRSILADALELGDILLEDYQEIGVIISNAKRLARKCFRFLWNACATLFVTLLISYLVLILLPEDSQLVNDGRQLIEAITNTGLSPDNNSE
ncbi:MAG: hypothetical protein WD071_07610 [Pseudohongiella sp.]|uniref:hypothetical protein n=1 Tax=Pseudohongiella sp. TaxID=1979412 RepID=UPI00349FEF69